MVFSASFKSFLRTDAAGLLAVLALLLSAPAANAQASAMRFVDEQLEAFKGKWYMQDGTVVKSDEFGTKGLTVAGLARSVESASCFAKAPEQLGQNYYRYKFDFTHPSDARGSIVYTYSSAVYFAIVKGRMLVRTLVYSCDTGKNRGGASSMELPYKLSKWYPNRSGRQSRDIATGYEFAKVLAAMDCLMEYYSCCVLADAFGDAGNAEYQKIFAAESERSLREFEKSGMRL